MHIAIIIKGHHHNGLSLMPTESTFQTIHIWFYIPRVSFSGGPIINGKCLKVQYFYRDLRIHFLQR